AARGIREAGVAWPPLDPTYPQERLRLILSESRMPFLLTRQSLRSSVPDCGIDVIELDDGLGPITGDDPGNPASRSAHDTLAYVLYTSGSTGQPKGVAMHHGPLCNLIQWQLAEATDGRKTLQFASLNFDVSFQEIFSTLCCGATLVMISQRMREDPVALLEYLREQNVE